MCPELGALTLPKVARRDSRGKRALDSRAQIAKMFGRQCAEGAVEPCLTPMTRSVERKGSEIPLRSGVRAARTRSGRV